MLAKNELIITSAFDGNRQLGEVHAMSSNNTSGSGVHRREFLKSAGAGIAAAGVVLNPGDVTSAGGQGRALTERERLLRIASCSYPVRSLFKRRAGAGRGGGGRRGGGAGAGTAPGAAQAQPQAGGGRGQSGGGLATEQMKAKYGEITMLDFPQFTKDTFPGVTHMDIWNSLCGDVTDESMYGQGGFDPSTPSGRKWIDALASKLVTTGTKIQHLSNNAPRNIAALDDNARNAGIAVARKWLDAAATLGIVSMRVNSGGPRIAPIAQNSPVDRYPKNDEIVPYMDKCVESFKEMADYGGKVGVKVTLENHWGLAANPMNIVAILEAVNHPYCEATPDFCNWEHEYMLFSGLKVLAPYSHSNVHAKYWERWGDKNDPQRATRVMLAGGFRGTFTLEYEAGPWDGVEGSRYLMREVLAALAAPHA
jgi:sugar phosphate isomerase/epimerase